jgi:hypothetical protein
MEKKKKTPKEKLFLCKLLYQKEYPGSCCYRGKAMAFNGKYSVMEVNFCNSERVISGVKVCENLGNAIEIDF